MSEAPLALAVLAFGLGGSLLLHLAVRAEGGRRRTMSRRDAERVARRDEANPEREDTGDGGHE